MNSTITDTSFAVLMAVYQNDDPDLLRMALDSVYANTLKPAVLVLVQDGPVGLALSGVISDFSVRKDFLLIKLPVNKGLANALNVGLENISNPFVFRADADDYNHPYRFAKQMSVFNYGYDLVGASIMEVDKVGKPIAIRRLPTSKNEIMHLISKRNPFNHMTVAYRRSSVIDVGGYPDIYLKEDYALWASMLANGAKMINIEEVLVNATTGFEMYKRRGGLKYVRSEIDIQKFLIKKGLQSIFGAIFIGVARSLVFLMPAVLRGFVYEKLLRDSV